MLEKTLIRKGESSGKPKAYEICLIKNIFMSEQTGSRKENQKHSPKTYYNKTSLSLFFSPPKNLSSRA